MILHTVSKSPFSNQAWQECLYCANSGDSILLLEDGVYAAMPGSQSDSIDNLHLYAIDVDVNARGLQDKLIPGVEIVDYARFVELTTTHKSVVSWY